MVKMTIGTEKILYRSKTTTQFLNCTRGIEKTQPLLHMILVQLLMKIT